MTPEEVELDLQWRARFGQPMPMLGCAPIVRQILSQAEANDDSPPARAA